MGVGLYIVWPAFYTDVTDAYRLSKIGRLRTDVGGVYFNALSALVAGLAYRATHIEPLLLVVVLVQLEMLQQFLPFIRLDGYYMISDLTGVPDLFTRIGPILRSLLPHQETDPRVRDLKRWVRITVTLWVLFLVPVLLFNFAVMLLAAPRILATMWSSVQLHAAQFENALRLHQIALAAVNGLQVVLLSLPAVGMAYMIVRFARRFFGKGRRWAAESETKRSVIVGVAMAVVGLLVFVWWPKSQYQAIGADERWTVPHAFTAIGSAASGGTPFLANESADWPVGSGPVSAPPHPSPPGPKRSGGALRKPTPAPAGTRTSPRAGATSGTGPSPTSSTNPSPQSSPAPSTEPSTEPSPTSAPSPSASTAPSPSSDPSPTSSDPSATSSDPSLTGGSSSPSPIPTDTASQPVTSAATGAAPTST
jgi:putative peptide zinc metalloprotease protein